MDWGGAAQILDLAGCKLKQLPDQITYLSKLVELDVSANLLESLPAAIGLLPRLNELKAINNALTDLPVSIACIPHLQVSELAIFLCVVGTLAHLRLR